MSAKIRALAVWMRRDITRLGREPDGSEILAIGGALIVWLDEHFQVHGKHYSRDAETPTFDVVGHPKYFIEIDDEPGSYRLRSKPEAREIPPEGLGGEGVTITCKQNERRNR